MAGGWHERLRSPLIGLEPHDPAPGIEDLRATYGREDFHELHLNEDQFGQAPELYEAAVAALATFSRYPDDGRAGFRRVLAGALGVPSETVVLAHGAQALIFAVSFAFLEAGSSAVVPGSTYGLYAKAAAAAGANVVRVPNRGLEIDLEGMGRAVREANAAVAWLCNPNNPTGLLLDAERWGEFLSGLPDYCTVVLDEAYIDFASDGQASRTADVAQGKPVIVLRTFSKVFGMAGLRLGYAVAHPEVARALDAVQGPFGVNRVALAAGRAAVLMNSFTARRRVQVGAARRLFSDLVTAGGMAPVPSEANFVLVDVGVDDVRLADALGRRGILVRPGSDWGLHGHVRVTLAPQPLMRLVAREMGRLRAEMVDRPPAERPA